MSFNRENVIFQQPNGLWARAFYTVMVVGDDPEWDVEYDSSSFEWLRTGLASVEAADAAWDGSNPGGHTILSLADDAAECARLWFIARPGDAAAEATAALAAAVTAPAAPAAPVVPAAADELDGLTFAELMVLARELKVPGRGTARIQALRDGIRTARAAA